jgi:proteasome lid subunit RPN8/RPN11
MLELTTDHYQAIARHAEQVYPEECCGLVFGWRAQEPQRAIATEIWTLTNAWSAEAAAQMAPLPSSPQTAAASSPTPAPPAKRQRYWIDPADLMAAQRYVRQQREKHTNPTRQFDMIGIYHSHPDHPAIPSECDRAWAWAEYSYLIVSVQQGHAQDLLSWTLDDCHQFQPQKLRIIDR